MGAQETIFDPATDVLVEELRGYRRLGHLALVHHAEHLDADRRGSAIEALARACRRALRAIAAAGGPPTDIHLDQLRRWLLRRGPGHHRRGEVDHTLGLIRGVSEGRTAAVLGHREAHLLADLVELDRALAASVRIGRIT